MTDDKSRLLTSELITLIIGECVNQGFPTREAVWQGIEHQDAKTALIKDAECQARVERIKEEIDKHFEVQGAWRVLIVQKNATWWLNLWKPGG